MRRGETGHYDTGSIDEEQVCAFIPDPLPHLPTLVLEGPLQQTLEADVLALGRLDGVSAHLPDKELFLYSYVRKEAVLSSQIEGTQSSLSDLEAGFIQSMTACRITQFAQSPRLPPAHRS